MILIEDVDVDVGGEIYMVLCCLFLHVPGHALDLTIRYSCRSTSTMKVAQAETAISINLLSSRSSLVIRDFIIHDAHSTHTVPCG